MAFEFTSSQGFEAGPAEDAGNFSQFFQSHLVGRSAEAVRSLDRLPIALEAPTELQLAGAKCMRAILTIPPWTMEASSGVFAVQFSSPHLSKDLADMGFRIRPLDISRTITGKEVTKSLSSRKAGILPPNVKTQSEALDYLVNATVTATLARLGPASLSPARLLAMYNLINSKPFWPNTDAGASFVVPTLHPNSVALSTTRMDGKPLPEFLHEGARKAAYRKIKEVLANAILANTLLLNGDTSRPLMEDDSFEEFIRGLRQFEATNWQDVKGIINSYGDIDFVTDSQGVERPHAVENTLLKTIRVNRLSAESTERILSSSDEKVQSAPKVLIVGSSGSGKSTVLKDLPKVINSLSNRKTSKSQLYNGMPISIDLPAPVLPIEHSTASKYFARLLELSLEGNDITKQTILEEMSAMFDLEDTPEGVRNAVIRGWGWPFVELSDGDIEFYLEGKDKQKIITPQTILSRLAAPGAVGGIIYPIKDDISNHNKLMELLSDLDLADIGAAFPNAIAGAVKLNNPAAKNFILAEVEKIQSVLPPDLAELLAHAINGGTMVYPITVPEDHRIPPNIFDSNALYTQLLLLLNNTRMANINGLTTGQDKLPLEKDENGNINPSELSERIHARMIAQPHIRARQYRKLLRFADFINDKGGSYPILANTIYFLLLSIAQSVHDYDGWEVTKQKA